MNTVIQQKVEDAIYHLDNQKAWQLLVDMKKQTSFDISHEDYLRLSYIRMNSLSTDHLFDLMKDSILVAFSMPDFDLKRKIIDYVELIDYVPAQVDFIVRLKNLLEEHPEQLGKTPITVNGKKVSPTISNWIGDFNSSTSVKEHDVLAELKYINTSINTKNISLELREVLKVLLNLYNLLLQYSNFWNNLPSELSESQLSDFDNYINSQLASDDGELTVSDSSQSTESTSLQPEAATTPPVIKYEEPVVPAPVQATANPVQQEAPQPVTPVPSQPAPQQQPTEEQLRTIEGIRLAKRTPGHYKDNNPATSGPLTSADSAKIHDLINKSSAANSASKRGVTMDPTNIKIDEEQKRLDSERNKKSLEIQKKLSELRTRNNNPK